MHESEAGIIRTERTSDTTYIVEFSAPDIAREVAPGQFVQVRTGNGTDPFLRRTFSVAGADPENGTLSLIVDVVGKGTGILCGKNRGTLVSLIGPLGTGFNIKRPQSGSSVFIGGGTGAAPLLFLAHTLRGCGVKNLTFMMGAKSSDGFGAVERLLPEGVELQKATDDGSCGHQGFVTGLLKETMKSNPPDNVFSCGPHLMLKTVSEICGERDVFCQISLEERMACGVGVCLGCAVKLTDGRMVRSCVDGPVFNASEVVL